MNTISDILQGMRLSGAVFLEARFSAPWSVKAHVTPEDCKPYMHVLPRQIIAYHLITAGRCIIALDTGTTASLKYGDLVILPRNTPHILASEPTVTPVSADKLIRHDGGDMAHILYGGGGASTQVLCGFLGSVTENVSLTALLPEILQLGSEDWAAASWIESTFRFAIQESTTRQEDSGLALARVAELLFFEAVRRYFALHPESRAAAVAGMHDALIGRALVLLQKRLYEHWTTESLAREIGLSRSSFADRFTRALGEPPMRYLARRRLEQASMRLLEPSVTITRVAFESGYESESAFNRAFRRMYGAPPAAWRRSMSGQAPDDQTA